MTARVLAAALLLLTALPASAAEPNPHNSLDCLFCHGETPRFGIDTRETVSFYRFEGDDPQLCYACHQPEQNIHPLGVVPGEGALPTKAPEALPLGSSEEFAGTVVCTTCHFIHASDSHHALLRGYAGSQEQVLFLQWQGLCRSCHGKNLEERSPHGGDERACAFCHAALPVEGAAVKVLPRGVALCNFCHGARQSGHIAGVNPFEGEVDCLSCHDPHLGPDSPARLKPRYFDFLRGAVTVNPHGRRTLCSLCHVEEKNFTLITQDRDALCNRCHGTSRVVGQSHPVSAVPDGMATPDGWPLRRGRITCLTCHLPGHEGDKGRTHLLRESPYQYRNDLCSRCHDFEELRKVNPHRLIQQLQGCETCHDRKPVFGKDTSETVTFKAAVNLLCLRCHDDTPHPANHRHTVELDEKEARTAASYFPLGAHRRMTCATCHNPHLPEEGAGLLREPVPNVPICTHCHF